MRSLKFITHPVLVVFTAFAFLFLVTGCERTVTMYDKDGKPYTAKEPDPWGTIGAIILTMFVVGGIAAAASSGDGSYLYNQNRPMLAFAGNRGYITDVSSGMVNSVKWFKLVDSEGNIISEHLIDTDKLMASRSFVNISDVQISSKVDKRMLRKLVQEIAKANNLNSVPRTIKTDIFYRANEENTLRVGAVSIPVIADQENRVSELTVMSENGIYKVSTALNKKSDRLEGGQLSVTVSQLN